MSRVTEQSHPNTETLSDMDVPQALQAVAAAEGEVFNGYQGSGGLSQPAFCNEWARVRQSLQTCLQQGGTVLMVGAGTSGRLARAVAAHHQPAWPQAHLLGQIAGGEGAMFRAVEGAEDDPLAGRELVHKTVAPGGPVWVIGISCGFSAAFVAGALEAACTANVPCLALGFNHLKTAADRPLPFEPGGFRALLQRKEIAVLNPILGPEAVRGSTRMKSGTATRIILDYLLHPDLPAPLTYLDTLAAVHRHFQDECTGLSHAVAAAAQGLKQGGRLFYLCDGDTFEAAVLDAAECAPTFGVHFDTVQAFGTAGGLTANWWSGHGDYSLTFFRREILPQLKKRDRIWVVRPHGGPLPDALNNTQAEIHRWQPSPATYENVLQNKIAPARACWWKWLYNSFSTCSFAAMGKVHGNRMIDLRISNLKLWDRAVGIVAEIAQSTPQKSHETLCQVVSPKDPLEKVALIKLAAKRQGVIPEAIRMIQAQKAPLNRID